MKKNCEIWRCNDRNCSNFIKCLQYCRLCDKCWKCITLSNLHNEPKRKVLWNRSSERLSDSLRLSQLISGEGRTQTPVAWLQTPTDPSVVRWTLLLHSPVSPNQISYSLLCVLLQVLKSGLLCMFPYALVQSHLKMCSIFPINLISLPRSETLICVSFYFPAVSVIRTCPQWVSNKCTDWLQTVFGS